MKREKGITLVALVITIIIMLILVAVVVYAAFSENGLIARSREAADRWRQEQENEMALGDVVDEILGDTPLTLVDDTGRPDLQSFIATYEVSAGDTIQAPVSIASSDNVQIDWGDGNTDILVGSNNQDNLTNGNYTIEKAGLFSIDEFEIIKTGSVGSSNTHIYAQAGTYDVTITGTATRIDGYIYTLGHDKLIEIKQWGVLGVDEIVIVSSGLKKIASPTQNSFIEVQSISFNSCAELEAIPGNLFANIPKVENFDWAFVGCESLATLPKGLFKNCINVKSFRGAFSHCSGLITIEEDVFAGCTNVESFQGTFVDCENLKSIPADLFKDCNKVTNFLATFQGCVSLTGDAIKLWLRTLPDGASTDPLYVGTPNGAGCYYDCLGLTGYDDDNIIPIYWKKQAED